MLTRLDFGDPNRGGNEFLPQRLGYRIQCVLGGAIDWPARICFDSCNRPDHDDMAVATALQHFRQNFPGHVQHAFDICIQHRIDHFVCDVFRDLLHANGKSFDWAIYANLHCLSKYRCRRNRAEARKGHYAPLWHPTRRASKSECRRLDVQKGFAPSQFPALQAVLHKESMISMETAQPIYSPLPQRHLHTQPRCQTNFQYYEMQSKGKGSYIKMVFPASIWSDCNCVNFDLINFLISSAAKPWTTHFFLFRPGENWRHPMPLWPPSGRIIALKALRIWRRQKLYRRCILNRASA